MTRSPPETSLPNTGPTVKAHISLELQHYDMMFHIKEASEGMRMTAQANAVVLTKSGLTSLVDRMEASGLIERPPDSRDRRTTRIHLTALGEESLAAASRHHRSVVRHLWTSRVSDEEATVIVDVLERVRAGLVDRLDIRFWRPPSDPFHRRLGTGCLFTSVSF